MSDSRERNEFPGECPALPPWSPRRRWRRLIVAVLLLGLALWLGGSYIIARELVQRSKPERPEPVPSSIGGLEAVRLTARDGETLGAWFVRGKSDRPAILLLHGHGGSRSVMRPQIEWLKEHGYAVLAVTLRAHGDSSGQLNDAGFSAALDVIASVDWLNENCPGQPIVVWGQSLGGAAAIFAAGELGDRVQGYILECVYADLRRAVWNRLDLHLPPVLSHVAYGGLMTVSPVVLPHLEAISPEKAAQKIPSPTPVLLLAGGKDVRATPAESRAIERAIGPNAEMIVFESAAHLGLWTADRERYAAVVTSFLARVPP